jgi:hypothetical protein
MNIKKPVIIASMILLSVSLSFSSEQNKKLYDPPILPVVLNIIPGLGIGSLVQGDLLSGILLMGGEVTGYALMISGAVQIMQAPYMAVTSKQTPDVESISSRIFTGAIVLTVTKLVGIVLPFVYNAVQGPESGQNSVSLSPGINFTALEDSRGSFHQTPVMGVHMSLTF